MSSWAACKNIYTDRVLQKSSTPISTQTSEDLWDWTNVHCCVKRDEHRYGYITRLLCALCQIYREGGGRRWRRAQRHTDGRGRDRDTGTESLSVAGKRVFFEGARDRDDLGLKWKRNVESFYPLLRVFYQPGPGTLTCTEVMSDREQFLSKIFHLERSSMRQSGCAHWVPLSPICTSTRLLNWF